MKRIGILGSGAVAKALAMGFSKHGFNVMIGTREPGKLAEWLLKNPGISCGTFEETARHGEALVLAVKGSAAVQALELSGLENLKGKIVMDTTNPLADAPPVDGVLKFFTSPEQSLMERLQSAFPESRFVKVFNSVGNPLMVNPDYGPITPTMFICGNDTEAKREVTGILELFGWESCDLGTATAARAIEPLCILWCIPGFLNNEWSHAFKLLKKPASAP
jgi:predicted dinucleotide-binding enzyme